MEKEIGLVCPRCGVNTLNVYYEDDGDLQLGAVCDSCGLRGFFMNNKLVQLAQV
jgi:transcription elongation factor Elf1